MEQVMKSDDKPKLDGTNYNEWAIATQSVLMFTDGWGITKATETEPDAATKPAENADWNKRRSRAAGYMIGKIAYEIVDTKLTDTERSDPKQIWDKMLAEYKRSSVLESSVCFKELIGFRVSETEDMRAQMQRFLYLINNCSKAGLTIDDQIKAHILLWNLPASYEISVAAYIGSLGKTATIDVNELMNRVYSEELRRKSSDSSGT